jgi:Flp pilus assembly protein CpaB
MKNVYGLLLAIGLAVAGSLFNWAYLAGKAKVQELDSFLGIAANVDIERGKRLEESQLVEVQIPHIAVGNLDQFAVRWSAKGSVIGQSVSRFLKGGSLLFRQDLETPPQQIRLGPEERIIWIPVDNRTFVPSLVSPGDQVWFVISAPSPSLNSIVEPNPEADGDTPAAPTPHAAPVSLARGSQPNQTIGPFTVKSLGIGVTPDAKGLPPDVQNLLDLLARTNFQPLGVMWRSQQKAE